MKVYIISDIHGCNKTFNALLNKIGLNKEDKLYLLGDYIDRGNDSSGVIDTILELKEKNYNVFPLRGNHEENILNAEKEYDLRLFTHFVKKMNKSGDLLNDDGTLISKYRDFFNTLPYYYIVGDTILVHAGFNQSIPDPFQDKVAMVELRGFHEIKENSVIGSRRVIHGHVPSELSKIQESIEKNKQVIPLDNGCVYNKRHKIYDITKLGQLMCLELNSFSLTMQKNID